VVRVVGSRLAWGVVVFLGAAVLDFGIVRLLQPELDPAHGFLGGLAHDLDRALLHFDFGSSCLVQGCPQISVVWKRYWVTDLYMLGGSLVIGLVGGWAGALLIARRTRLSRVLDGFATFAFCAPVFFVGMGLLLLFEHLFGKFPLPILFTPGNYTPPQEDFWQFLNTMIVPWIVLALPVMGATMRLAGATMADTEDPVLSAAGRAKGLGERQLVRRFTAPAAYPLLASYLGVTAPLYILNVAIVEWCFSVPGAFAWTKRALGQDDPRIWPTEPDVPWLQALGLWAAALIVVMVVISDILLALVDPEVRASHRRRARVTNVRPI
jgi:peptide/nickel transport system permease protein